MNDDLARPWHAKEPVSDTAAVQRQKVRCRHVVWYHGEVLLFGYLKVYGICVLCRTRLTGPPPDHYLFVR